MEKEPAAKRLKTAPTSLTAEITESIGLNEEEQLGSSPFPNHDDQRQEEKLPEIAPDETAPALDKSPEEKAGTAEDTKLRWPWIPLLDSSGRQYFYNASTSKTSWTRSEEGDSGREAAPPPTAYSVAAAQSAWQRYWAQWQSAQESKVLTRCVPGLSRPAPLEDGGEEVEEEEEGNGEKKRGRSMAASMSVFIEHYQSPTADQLKRPARQQVRPPDTETLGYTQGYEEYNIWYGKHLSDQFDVNGGGRREEKEKAATRCNPFTDSGWTRCNLEPELDRPVICIYFARGCCYLGSNCRYYHRLPTAEDDEKLDMLHDIFGRERFAAHRDDMDGVGTFSEECRTLFIGDLKVNRVYPNAEEKAEELIKQQFGLWGPLEDIKVIRNKNIAFIRYKYRVHAEFAKVSMAEQRLLLDRPDDQICVKWAHPGKGNEDKPNEQHAREWEAANQAMMKRLTQLGYTQDDLECYIRWEINQGEERDRNEPGPTVKTVTSTYPNTDHRLMTKPVPLSLANGDSAVGDDITSPDSNSSKQLYRMQEETPDDPDVYTVTI